MTKSQTEKALSRAKADVRILEALVKDMKARKFLRHPMNRADMKEAGRLTIEALAATKRVVRELAWDLRNNF